MILLDTDHFSVLKYLDQPKFAALAAGEFMRLRRQGVRIGSLDLKIASIALVQGATLLSANVRDFRKVPGLKVENWLE
jgi:tRNA(fMet)-specific endonuclease VapC